MRRIVGCLGYLVISIIKMPFSIVSFIATNVEITLSLLNGKLVALIDWEPFTNAASNVYMKNAENFYTLGEIFYDEALEL